LKTAQLIRAGRSQSVRLPREFHVTGKGVYIKRMGSAVVLWSKDDPWAPLRDAQGTFSPDCFQERAHRKPQPKRGSP
jgi:virulence-associated protein VagC